MIPLPLDVTRLADLTFLQKHVCLSRPPSIRQARRW